MLFFGKLIQPSTPLGMKIMGLFGQPKFTTIKLSRPFN
jgi:hypothetical protein